MWQELGRKHSFYANAQQYEIKWQIDKDNCMCRLEIYRMPEKEPLVSAQWLFPCATDINEYEAYFAAKEKEIEDMTKGKSLTDKELIGKILGIQDSQL